MADDCRKKKKWKMRLGAKETMVEWKDEGEGQKKEGTWKDGFDIEMKRRNQGKGTREGSVRTQKSVEWGKSGNY